MEMHTWRKKRRIDGRKTEERSADCQTASAFYLADTAVQEEFRAHGWPVAATLRSDVLRSRTWERNRRRSPKPINRILLISGLRTITKKDHLSIGDKREVLLNTQSLWLTWSLTRSKALTLPSG